MIRLYHGTGALDFQLLGRASSQEWTNLQGNVARLLRARGFDDSAGWLGALPFELYEGTNFFNDDFSVLYSEAPIDRYVELAESSKDEGTRRAFRRIADAISEIGPGIRFIAVELDANSDLEAVPEPPLQITSETVERALADCRQLMQSQGAASGVDRVHTAFHGYLRVVCSDAGIEVPEDVGITQLFKAIREQHEGFRQTPRLKDIDRIARAMATIVDSLNPLRNDRTLAHPNEEVLEEADAMLVINSVRTLLHYVNSKVV